MAHRKDKKWWVLLLNTFLLHKLDKYESAFLSRKTMLNISLKVIWLVGWIPQYSRAMQSYDLLPVNSVFTVCMYVRVCMYYMYFIYRQENTDPLPKCILSPPQMYSLPSAPPSFPLNPPSCTCLRLWRWGFLWPGRCRWFCCRPGGWTAGLSPEPLADGAWGTGRYPLRASPFPGRKNKREWGRINPFKLLHFIS